MSNTTLDDVLYEFFLNTTTATGRELLMAKTIVNLREQLASTQQGDPELLEAARSFLTAMTYERNEKEVALYKVVRARMDTTATEAL